jgi:hypothetical protein
MIISSVAIRFSHVQYSIIKYSLDLTLGILYFLAHRLVLQGEVPETAAHVCPYKSKFVAVAPVATGEKPPDATSRRFVV